MLAPRHGRRGGIPFNQQRSFKDDKNMAAVVAADFARRIERRIYPARTCRRRQGGLLRHDQRLAPVADSQVLSRNRPLVIPARCARVAACRRVPSGSNRKAGRWCRSIAGSRRPKVRPPKSGPCPPAEKRNRPLGDGTSANNPRSGPPESPLSSVGRSTPGFSPA